MIDAVKMFLEKMWNVRIIPMLIYEVICVFLSFIFLPSLFLLFTGAAVSKAWPVNTGHL